MLWSLFKVILFLLLVTAATFGAIRVIELGGEVTIAIGTVEFALSPLAALLALVAILLAAWVVLKLVGLVLAVFRFLNGDETAITRYFDKNRERKGFAALTEGMMALASGEGRVALAKAARAEKYLKRPELTLLLTAQAAELAGDTARAQQAYRQLVADERTRFVGIQGILKQKLAEGDTDTALKLAEKAFALRPRHERTMDVLFALQSQKHDWKGARDTLRAKLRARALPKDVHARRDAVLALAEARERIAAGDEAGGYSAALEANRLSPGLVPAAVLVAQMQAKKGHGKAAAKVLKKAWTAQPHPDLAAAFAALEPDETPARRRQRFQPLLKINPDDPETRLLAAELAVADEDFAAARKALGDLAETRPTTRSLALMAAIEKGQGAPESVVRGWLARALTAPRGPHWICRDCHHIHAEWVPICENCNHFDTLDWAMPPAPEAEGEHPPELLPLIAALLEDRRGDEDEPKPAAAPDAPADTPPEETAEGGTAEGDTTGIAGDAAPRSKTPASGESPPASGESPKVIDTRPATRPAPDDLARKVADSADDMDGILGDPHVIPDIGGKRPG